MALAIVGIVCVGTLGAYGAAIRADIIAADRLPLASLATERLAAVDLHAGSIGSLPESLAHGAFDPPYAPATWDIETQPVPSVDGLFDVVVRVRDGTDMFTLRTRRSRAPGLAASLLR